MLLPDAKGYIGSLINFLYIGLLLFVNISTYGQANTKQASLKNDFYDGNILRAIRKNFKPDYTQLDSACINMVVHIKFIVGRDGKIKEVTSSLNTPGLIDKAIQAAIHSTDNHWVPKTVRGVSMDSQPFILPIILNFRNNCSETNPKDYINGINQTLSYEGTPSGSLDCILLNSIEIRNSTKKLDIKLE